MISTTERPRGTVQPWTPLKAIAVGGLLAGAWDMGYALLWFGGVKGVPWGKIPQSVAAGLIGKASVTGGAGALVSGLALHWLFAFIWATFYVVGARLLLPTLRGKPIPYGLAYGA